MYLGDFAEDETIYLMFNTFTSDDPSASATITNFTNTDVHIHKDDGLTQRNNAAGITVSIDFDGITGSHMIKIDTSDDTVAGFWVTGSDYFVRIEGATVDAATLNVVVGHFSIENRFMRGTDSAATAAALSTHDGKLDTVDGVVDAILLDTAEIGTAGAGLTNINLPNQTMDITGTISTVTDVTNQVTADVTAISGDTTAADNLEAQFDGTGYTEASAPAKQSQLAAIANVGSAINTPAESFTKSGAEGETLTYTATHELDDSYHEVAPDGTTTDVYYEFDVGANGIPSSVTWEGYVQGNNDTYDVFAYNFSGTAWEQIGSVVGTWGTTKVTESWSMTTAHVSSANKVRVRFYSTDGSSVATDRILCAYSVIVRSVGYSLGAIWVDSAGTAGTEDYVNGTADNPCPWANALTISASLGIKKFVIANGNTVQLSAAADNYTMLGYEWNLDLNGQSITSAFIEQASVYGTGTGTGYRLVRCKLALSTALSLQAGGMKECVLGSAGITLSAAGTFMMKGCSGANDSAYINFETDAENKSLFISDYMGDIEVQNFGHATATHAIAMTGQGHFIFNSNCSAADAGDTLDIHGIFHITDNVSGGWGGTIKEEARIDIPAINAECDTALSDYDPPTKTEMDTAFAALNDLSAADIWDAASALTLDFGTLLERAYEMTSNKMTVNESSGAVALRNIGDTANIATGEVLSSAGTTHRNELSWA